MKQLLIETEIIKVIKAECNCCAEYKHCFQAPHPVQQIHLRNTGEFLQNFVTGLGKPIPKQESYTSTTDVYICQDCAQQLMEYVAPTHQSNTADMGGKE